MNIFKKSKLLILLTTALFLISSLSSFAMAPEKSSSDKNDHADAVLSPSPITVDRVIHNRGNIVTTIENWGYLGGYQMGEPSGQYPRNSGRDYLAEALYWMGTVTPAGDTLVANSYDDFEALPMPINGEDAYKIYLSTDPERYYSYDENDTVGLSTGRPANGWRIWDGLQQSYDYNESYNSLSTAFIPSGPSSLQDSHYRFCDAALGSPLLGLEMTQTIYQWNYCYNEDFMFIQLDITNTSANDYAEFAFGLYIDIDVGGDDGVGGNGRQEDVVEYDIAENTAFIYDVIGIDPGWGPTVQTGVMGTKFLETPNNIGVTAIRTDDWAFLPSDDEGRFAMINSQQYDTPLPPTDQFYIQCVRGINLTAGSSVKVVYALIAGDDSTDFNENAAKAQQIYDNFFIGPEPPPTPQLSARAADEKVYLSWTDVSEIGSDPLSGENDFAGYKLYRSDNQGKTWGVVNYQTGNNCLDIDYAPVASYAVSNPSDPIPHSFIDDDLYNGVEYWYCLAAFDKGDVLIGIDALQSGFGVAGETPNVIKATPHNDPAGYVNALTTIEHEYTGNDLPSEGEVIPILFDESEVQGDKYQVVFEDFPDTTYWHLINLTTGDTVLQNQTQVNVEDGYFDVIEGLRIVVNNGDMWPRSFGQTAFGLADTTLVEATFYGGGLNTLFGVESMDFGHEHFRSTYEFRYTGDSTLASWMLDGYHGTEYFYWVPFEVWNTSSNERVSLAVYDFELDDIWQPYDLLQIVNYPYDSTAAVTDQAYPYYYSWLVGFDETIYNPQLGDVYTVEGAPLNGPSDKFTFDTDGIDKAAASGELADIRVVPNPYLVKYSSMVETTQGESVLEFQKIPDECVIRIYNISGDLVKTIDHNDGSGTARWNLLSESYQQIASGTYIYHVESPYGEFTGRFAVIQ